VGVDIGCGMGAMRTSLGAADLPESLRRIRSELEDSIPVGFDSHDELVKPRDPRLKAQVKELLDGFARLIVRLSGTGSDTAVGRLDPTLAQAGGPVALEAAWRAILEVAQGAVDAVRRRLAGEPVTYDPPVESVQQTEQFLESLSLETIDLQTVGPRLVRLCHALDHLTELHEDLTRIPPTGGDGLDRLHEAELVLGARAREHVDVAHPLLQGRGVHLLDLFSR